MILKKLLGEIMADMGFVTREQLDEAIKRQSKILEEKTLPERLQRPSLVSEARETKDKSPMLGKILTDMGFVTKEQLEEALKEQERIDQVYKSLESEKLGIAIEIGSIINSSLNISEVLHLIMKHVNQVTNSIASTLMLLDENTRELVFSVPTGPEADKLTDIRLPPGKGIAGWVTQHDQPVLVPDAKEDPRFSPEIEKIRGIETKSILCVPLKVKTKLIGVLEVINKVDGTFFTEEDGLLMNIFASQAAMAIENARLHGEFKDRLEDLKQAEEALRESEERYREFVEGTDDLIIRVDGKGKLIYVNDTAEKIFDLNKEECIGLSAFDFIHPDDLERTREAFDRWIRDRVPSVTLENRLVSRNGEVHHMLWTVNLHFDNEGNTTSINSIARDLTERKRVEEEKKKMEIRFRESQKMEAIATLAGGIAHQFNNALSAITVNLDLLEMDSPQDENLSKYVKPMKVSAHRMAQLTSQLLAYARGGKYQVKTVSFSDFVRDTLPMIKHTVDPSIYVDTDLPLNILEVKADLTQMQMVLSAILNNASEALEGEGRIRISTRNEVVDEDFTEKHPGLKPGPYVCLTIEDDGKGMDEETSSRVFEPFFTTKFQGRGLGMAAVYGIVKSHDGWISVDSELGKGTVVRIYLPAIEALREVGKPKIGLPKGTGTIFVIEDEEMVMDVTQAILKRMGYRVLEAKTGKEAIDIAETFDGGIDMAILDIVLPDMHGKEVYKKVIEARPSLKVIVCSGYTIDGPAQEILDAGAQGFIQKPFTITTLSEKLKEVLESK